MKSVPSNNAQTLIAEYSEYIGNTFKKQIFKSVKPYCIVYCPPFPECSTLVVMTYVYCATRSHL